MTAALGWKGANGYGSRALDIGAMGREAWLVGTTWPAGVVRQAAGCEQNPDGCCGVVGWNSLPGAPGGPQRGGDVKRKVME